MGKKTKRYCQECFGKVKQQEEVDKKFYVMQDLPYPIYVPMKQVEKHDMQTSTGHHIVKKLTEPYKFG